MICLSWSEKNRTWVGMDVNVVESMEEGEASSMPDTAEGSEGENIDQNADKQEDENSRSMGADLQENSCIEQPLASGERLPGPEDSTGQNPSKNIHSTKESFIRHDATRGTREKLLDRELAHVIVDEEVDFDQFGAPPPDLPIIDDLGNVEDLKSEDQIIDLDADNGFKDGESALKDTEEKEQLQVERYPEPHGDLKPAGSVSSKLFSLLALEDDNEHDVHRDLDTEPTAGRNETSEVRESETVNPEDVGDAASESALTILNTKSEEEGHSALEESQKRTEDLIQSKTKQLEDLGHQLDLSNTRLEEQSKIHEELLRKLEAESDKRLESVAKLMVLHEILPNLEEKLKNLSHQVQFLEVQLQEQADLRNILENDLQQEWKEKTQYVMQLEEQTRLHHEVAKALDEERDGRLKGESDLVAHLEMFTNEEGKVKDLRDQVDSLVVQLQEETELRKSLEENLDRECKEKMQYVTRLKEQTSLHEELTKSLEEQRDGRLKSESDLMVLHEMLTYAERTMKDLRDQVDALVVQLQEETEWRISIEEKLDWDSKERMQHMAKIEEQTRLHEELSLIIEEERGERFSSENLLEELRGTVSNKEEKIKDLHSQVESLTAQLHEQKELKKELEGKWDHEFEGRMQDVVTLPVSSMPWSEEKLEFEKLLDEQKALLKIQMQEAEKLKNAAEAKVGLLNHQVQNLEVLTDIAETMEYVFSAKERFIKQAMLTGFQALCLGVGLLSFFVAHRDPLQSSLEPT